METNLYNQKGDNIGKIKLPDSIFGLKLNMDLLYQVVTAQRANKRQIIAHAKGRNEVRGGGKKPWRQKGTGRARQSHGVKKEQVEQDMDLSGLQYGRAEA